MTRGDPRPWLRRAARSAGFGGVMAVMYGAYLAHARAVPPAEREALLVRYRGVFLDVVLGLFRVEVLAAPPSVAPTPAATARLVVANHRAALDIPVLLRLFGGHVLSRADLADWPLFGAVARAGGTIFVDRAEGMSRVAAARVIRRRLAQGATVTIFPEGTTFAGDDVQAFHGGAFAAVRGLPVEVIPVGLAYAPGTEWGRESFLAHLAKTASRPATRVAVCVGAPVVLPPNANARAAAERCHAEVQRLVRAARQRFDQPDDLPRGP